MRWALKWMLRLLLVLLLGVAVFGAIFAISAWDSFGSRPEGTRQARIEQSPNWRDGAFRNIRPTWLNLTTAFRRAFFGPAIPAQSPEQPIVPVHPAADAFAASPASGLRVTWFGHSSTLVEIDGVRVLTDPFWGERASPVGWAGPKRWFAPPVALADLPPIDAVVISHDHYDHLDRGTIQALNQRSGGRAIRFVAPLGIGAHLQGWGVSPDQIVELDWWGSTRVGDVTITATPARHNTGRTSSSSNRVFWAGYALTGPKHRVWYSGDTGLLPEFREIGRRLGPFDLTMIENGQYSAAWPDNHMAPESVVQAHRLVRGKLLLPVHWGLISLAPHGWTEPVERVTVAARCAGVRLALPRPGQSFEPDFAVPTARWWPAAPWQTAAQAPAPATVNGDPARRFALPRCG